MALVAALLTVFSCPSRATRACRAWTSPGSALSVAMLGLLTWTIIEAPSRGWSLAGDARRLRGQRGPRRRCSSWWSGAPRTRCSTSALFADRRFSAASGAVTVTFFALFGFIFLITQYFQLIRGYGTLSTGARILPVALSIAVASVLGAHLAPRVGTKAVVTTGLLMFGDGVPLGLHGRPSTRRTPP